MGKSDSSKSLDLEPILERHRLADHGPWQVDPMNVYILLGGKGHGSAGIVADTDLDEEDLATGNNNEAKGLLRIRGFGRGAPQQANLEFIAEARTDVPNLCREVSRLRRLVESRREEVESAETRTLKAAKSLDSLKKKVLELASNPRGHGLMSTVVEDITNTVRNWK